MDKRIEMKIERSIIPGMTVGNWFDWLFLVVFFGVLLLIYWGLLWLGERYLGGLWKWADTIAFFVTLVLAFLLARGRTGAKIEQGFYRLGGNEQELEVEFSKDRVVVKQGRMTWKMGYDQIVEVGKMMWITRYYPEKGRYRVKIRRKGRRNLVFFTTTDEYEAHKDFEDTELSRFYYGFKDHGVKCC